jgi:general secretion pathway protein A
MNMSAYEQFFGFDREVFPQDIAIKDIYRHPELESLFERFKFSVDLCTVSVITGDVGSGKSTSLRYAVSKLHSSEYHVVQVIANTGTYVEVLRQIAFGLTLDVNVSSITKLSGRIRNVLLEITNRKMKPVLIIDESHLLRLDVFAQLHTLFEFEFDSKPVISVIFCGQKNLIDSLSYHKCRSLASRVIGRTHLEGLQLDDMREYLKHHLKIAGMKTQLFSDEAITAIHQGSGGLLRRANYLAKGGLVAAFKNNTNTVSAEHIRIASTEII